MSTDLEPNARPNLRQVPQPEAEERYQSLGYRAKRAMLGPPFKTAQLAHERISKRVALAVFSSDPISSTAYATEEMLLVWLGFFGQLILYGAALNVVLDRRHRGQPIMPEPILPEPILPDPPAPADR